MLTNLRDATVQSIKFIISVAQFTAGNKIYKISHENIYYTM